MRDIRDVTVRFQTCVVYLLPAETQLFDATRFPPIIMRSNIRTFYLTTL